MPDAKQPAGISTFRLRRRTPGSFLLVPCPKQGRSIRCQGQLEAAAAVILVACPRVAFIQEQPFAVWYQWLGAEETLEIQLLDGPPATPRPRQKDAGVSYIVPDFLVEMVDGSKRLVEVKPSQQLARPIVQRKLAVGRLYGSESGATFYVVTEKQLLENPLLANLRLVNRYRQAHTDADVLEQLVLEVPAGGIDVSTLLSGRDPTQCSDLRMHLFHLLATGRLSFDPCARPIDDQTLIFPGGVISWDPFDSLWTPSGSSTGGSGAWSANSPPTALLPKTSSST